MQTALLCAKIKLIESSSLHLGLFFFFFFSNVLDEHNNSEDSRVQLEEYNSCIQEDNS